MGLKQQIRLAKNDIARFSERRNAEFRCPMDATNLINAIERLRLLKAEALANSIRLSAVGSPKS
jgi:hypothetical protein